MFKVGEDKAVELLTDSSHCIILLDLIEPCLTFVMLMLYYLARLRAGHHQLSYQQLKEMMQE